ncbi:MAG: acyl-CoA dehydrogenase family protein [Deltaproteobacteria bacterium]|nr:acyl-CoA dehydrogenase family protein [Deltaproteobacteria bacterium]
MNFELTPDQKLLVDTVTQFVRKDSPVARFRALREDPLGYSRDVWRQMGELGWLGVSLPEEAGGFGGSFVESMLILQQFGTTLVPEPYVPSVVLAGTALARAGSPAQLEQWLSPMLAGQTSLALAYGGEKNRGRAAEPPVLAQRSGAGYRLSGEARWVLNGHGADQVVVSARAPEGPTLFVVPRTAPGLRVTPVRTIDGQHAATLAFGDVEVPEESRLGAPGSAGPLLEDLVDLGAAAACAEGLGVMERMLRLTVEYLNTRVQFGVKIGVFQALQHRAVDMFVATELAKSMAIMAAIRVGDPDVGERRYAVSAAKVQLAQSGRFVSQQAIQLHGGIGITDEHDIGLYFKRLHALGVLFGDEEHHVERFSHLPVFTAGLGG